ncbi:MAG TPA: dTDP-4-dehydrorhamnose reductase [Candidatus Coprenecus stercoravium]|uniref:dTDP-4-dehydrorhamnose reductase n=1 Tax=Candidatus Coprenecus stercoravium TaxID=2840735 RepID=A0A9D2KB35_9BACT|nr:dTDP-4-dehydrorhamnose reductase [Candidatus Coprenecus stercoravium]
MDNILITGADGQLGSELRFLTEGKSDDKYFYTDAHELDITDADAVMQFVESNHISKIINCAAYNNVEQAETDTDAAIRLNVNGPMNLAAAAAEHGAWLVHVSTDFVFDGEKRSPYHESDRPAPLSGYGRTKLAGEIAVKKSGCLSIIIRTSWLYSPYGKKNFVKTMIAKGLEEDFIDVVNDQTGTPTYARDLAEAILHILPQLDGFPRYGEVFHYSDEGSCTWAGFADKIMKLRRLECEINPVSSSEYHSAAARPAYSVLDKSLIRTAFGVKVPLWERSLSKAIRLF